jgi:hypothetical protein
MAEPGSKDEQENKEKKDLLATLYRSRFGVDKDYLGADR